VFKFDDYAKFRPQFALPSMADPDAGENPMRFPASSASLIDLWVSSL
jgi:hypothetical protein